MCPVLLTDRWVIRLLRRGVSCPVGIGVSCSADQQVSYRTARLWCLMSCRNWYVLFFWQTGELYYCHFMVSSALLTDRWVIQLSCHCASCPVEIGVSCSNVREVSYRTATPLCFMPCRNGHVLFCCRRWVIGLSCHGAICPVEMVVSCSAVRRVIWKPCHGTSCFVGVGVFCSAVREASYMMTTSKCLMFCRNGCVLFYWLVNYSLFWRQERIINSNFSLYVCLSICLDNSCLQ